MFVLFSCNQSITNPKLLLWNNDLPCAFVGITDSSTMANASNSQVTEEQEFPPKNKKDPVTAGLTHPLIADKLRQKHFINHRRTKHLRRAKYVLDSSESEQQPFSYSFVDNSNARTPEKEREREREKQRWATDRRAERSRKNPQQTDIKTTRGSSDWILLSAAPLPAVQSATTERRSGASNRSVWLVGCVVGWRVGGRPCVTKN